MALLITPIAIGSIEEQKEESYNSIIEDTNNGFWECACINFQTALVSEGIVLCEEDTASDGVDPSDMDYTVWNPDFAAYFLEGTRYLGRDVHLGPKENRPSWTGTYGADIWTFRTWSLATTQVTVSWDMTDIEDFGYNAHFLHIYSAGIHVCMDDTQSVSYTNPAGQIITGKIDFCYSDPPEDPEKPSGPSALQRHEVGEFSTVTTDPSLFPVRYKFQWGDGTYSEWSNLGTSGERFYKTHHWSQPGTYTVRARAKNMNWAYSDWSPGLQVTVTEEQTGSPPEIPEILDAPSLMQYGETYEFTAVTTDPDDDQIFYNFIWDTGEGDVDIFSDYMESGEPCTIEHSFESFGDTRQMCMEVRAIDTNDLVSEWSECHPILLSDPPTEVYITGPTSGTAGEEYVYQIRGYDPNNNDLVDFAIDWGDGDDVFISDIPIMSEVNVSHIWSSEGDYQISVTVYDFNGLGGPTETLSVSMPKVKAHRWFHPWLSGLFERFPFLEPLLQQILGLQ